MPHRTQQKCARHSRSEFPAKFSVACFLRDNCALALAWCECESPSPLAGAVELETLVVRNLQRPSTMERNLTASMNAATFDALRTQSRIATDSHDGPPPRWLRRARWLPLGLALMAGCWGESVPQSADCATYVACIQAQDTAAGQITNLDRYAEGGACWGNSTLATGCTTSCKKTLARINIQPSGLPQECRQ